MFTWYKILTGRCMKEGCNAKATNKHDGHRGLCDEHEKEFNEAVEELHKTLTELFNSIFAESFQVGDTVIATVNKFVPPGTKGKIIMIDGRTEEVIYTVIFDGCVEPVELTSIDFKVG